MGKLIEGKWTDIGYETEKNQGQFLREETNFRNQISDSSPTFAPERDRYHLYVSYACPWAHRTLIMRHLKGLQEIIPVSVVHPHMLSHGWEFRAQGPYQDNLYQLNALYELYLKASKNFTGRVTVPVLWDKKNKTIVNNESSEIIRIFNSAFNKLTGDVQNFYPSELQQEIDQINKVVYDHVNNGVYQCGFATTQEAYEQAFDRLFATLAELNDRLSKTSFLIPQQLTEADIRLFTTLIRFDAVYFGHFKCNLKRVEDFPNLFDYLKRLLEFPSFRDTVNLVDIKQHYYYSHDDINPTRIVPKGPQLSWLMDSTS